MTHPSAARQRDDQLVKAIDDLLATFDDDAAEADERERQRARAHAEFLQRRLALILHDLGVAELTADWVTAGDGCLTFADLTTERAERLILALETIAQKHTRFRW